jgi:hypothetical protein
MQRVIPLLRDMLENANRFTRDFRSDAIARENEYV